MKASELIEQLRSAVEQHADLDVSVIVGNHEYLVTSAEYAGAGSIEKHDPHQNPPARIVLDAEDKLDDA